jgi:hypothetical protein
MAAITYVTIPALLDYFILTETVHNLLIWWIFDNISLSVIQIIKINECCLQFLSAYIDLVSSITFNISIKLT